MSKVTFEFQQGGKKDQTFDILLCTHRRALYHAVVAAEEMLREVLNGKSYAETTLYPIEKRTTQSGYDEVTKWSTEPPKDGDDFEYTGFISLDYVIGKLQEALSDVPDFDY